MASRSASRRSAWPSAATAGRKTPDFSCPTACASIFTPASARAASDCAASWSERLRRLSRQTSRSGRRNSSACGERELPDGWDADLPSFPPDAKGLATPRSLGGKALNAIAAHYPWLIGGAADLAPSTKTRLTFEGAGDFEAGNYGGRNLHFGIREHAMGAIVNGLALSGLRAYRLDLPDFLRLHEAGDPAGAR